MIAVTASPAVFHSRPARATDQILLRTDRAVFKMGDRIQLKMFSTRARGFAYLDIVKNGQTVLTRDVDLHNGQAELTLNATPEMVGTLDIDAYLFGRDAQAVADHRLVFVQPADELKIETTASAAVYKPGSDARIHFHVTNSRGEGVNAALGLQVVDQAVFALAEKQPGFAKVFFYLEQEVMKPRYEIHSLSMSDVVESGSGSAHEDEERHNLAARALFSATGMTNPAKLDTEFGRSLPQDKYEEYAQRYHAVFFDQVNRLAAKLNQGLTSPSHQEIASALDQLTSTQAARDSWNTPLRFEPVYGNRGADRFYLVRSAGPDRQFNSADDLTVYIEDRSGTVVSRPHIQAGFEGSFDLKIEHDRGPFTGRAEITGTVTDPSGANVPGAAISLRLLSNKETRTAHADAAGRFNLAALRAGLYEAEISSPGFMILSRQFTLQPRDRAVISATLAVGAVSQSVAVAQIDAVMVTNKAVAGGSLDELRFAPPASAPGIAGRQVTAMALNGRNFTQLTAAGEGGGGAPHVRSYFPEALYINPEIITDGHGDASISIPMADSITTWRMAMIASTRAALWAPLHRASKSFRISSSISTCPSP